MTSWYVVLFVWMGLVVLCVLGFVWFCGVVCVVWVLLPSVELIVSLLREVVAETVWCVLICAWGCLILFG